MSKKKKKDDDGWFKSKLAEYLDITVRTLWNYMQPFKEELAAMGLSPRAKKLPPHVLKFLSEKLCFDYNVTQMI